MTPSAIQNMADLLEDGNFTVRQASSLDDLRWIVEWGVKYQGWMHRVKDAEYLFSLGFTKFFFLGELNGVRISSVAIIEYNEMLAMLGYFLVVEGHRGKGYGLRTLKYAFETSSAMRRKWNVGVSSAMQKEMFYKKNGFSRVWIERRYEVKIGNFAKAVSGVAPPSGIRILPGSVVDIDELVEYDKSIFGVARRVFLASWMCICDFCYVAVNRNTEIVGYIVFRKRQSFVETGYCVTPLFADNLEIAQCLLKQCIDALRPGDSDKALSFDIPLDDNPMGVKFLETIADVVTPCDTVFMYTEGVSNYLCKSKVFSVAGLQFG
jgi:GNAT superfamily N-acetyltransferase